MKKRNRSKEWIFFVAVAVLVHLALFIYIKPSFFLAFRQTSIEDATTAPHGTRSPDAIVYIPIDFSDTEILPPLDELATEEPTVPPTDQPLAPRAGAPSRPDSSLDDVFGDAPPTLPPGPGANVVEIPPRPLEITWPDTRSLKHCLGHQITVRIQVGGDGSVLQVDADANDHPADCVAAAIQSAWRIVFAPGRINGKPVKMWTEVRIDFKKRN